MKKILLLIFAFIIIGSAAFLPHPAADSLQPIPFPFIGKWNPSEDPALLDDYGIQDIQNLRKTGKHFKGIGGHTKINSTSVATYPYLLNGFHFYKDQPQESHVIVLATSTTTSPGASYLYQNTTAIPGTGDFSATTLHSDTSGGIATGRFALAPAGNMIYTNGAETLIWGGNEIEPVAFISYSTALTGTTSQLSNPKDFSEAVRNTRQTGDQVARITSDLGSYVMYLFHMDGADASTDFTNSATASASTATVHGDAQIDTSQFRFATGSGYFDGDGDYLTISDGTDSDLSGGVWTIDFWFRAIDFNSRTIYYQQTDATHYTTIYLSATSVGNWLIFDMQSTGSQGILTSNKLNTNQWYHVAVVDNGDHKYLFINGNQDASLYPNSNHPANYAGDVYIGSNATPGNYFNGWLDEFRLSNGVAMWTSNFTPQTTPYSAASQNWLVGFYRPIQGVKFYVSEANVSASTTTVQEWNGVSWSDLSVTDNTSSGGISLAQTGTVTWNSTVNTSKPRLINGLSLYWYQFQLSDGNATIYYATVDAPIQEIRNVWDGAQVFPAKVLLYSSASTTYEDYTADVIDDLMTTYLDASTLGTSDYILAGFTDPQQAINLTLKSGSENTASSAAMTLSYWNGKAWVATTAFYDGTATGTTPLSKSGVVSWQAENKGVEFTKTIADEAPLYYYKIAFGGTLDGDTKIAEIKGIPSPPSLATYTFGETFQNRLFLFNEYNGEKNKAIYSGANTPDIFNGSDSSYLYFGDKTGIIAAKPLYNVFRTFAADQLIVAKKNETWRVSGDGPENWVVNRMSSNIGCVAPLSMVVCEVADGAEAGVKRQVVIWQSDKEFVMTDGAAIIPISDDIRCYFDPNDTRYIPTSRRSKTVAWYDPFIRSYKALISSGSTATYHNVELEYNLEKKEWTKIYREDASGADPLQSGFQVFDITGVGYTYGGNRKGFIYRLENGATFAGTAITEKLQTKDIILDTQIPLFRKSTVKFMRTAYKQKTGSISIAHYGDRVLTVDGSTNQVVPDAVTTTTGYYNTQSCNLGPFLYHSFLFTSVTSATDGMELNGLAIYAEPYTAMR